MEKTLGLRVKYKSFIALQLHSLCLTGSTLLLSITSATSSMCLLIQGGPREVFE